MIPTRKDLKARADYGMTGDDGYVRVPASDWEAVLWLLEVAESAEEQLTEANEALRDCALAASNGLVLYSQRKRGTQEKLTYIRTRATDAVIGEPD